jgi:hypothetical protein
MGERYRDRVAVQTFDSRRGGAPPQQAAGAEQVRDGRLAAEMATKKECEAALRGLAKRLDGVDDSLKKRHAPDRTVTCRISDLDTTFSGRLSSGALSDIRNKPLDNAQIRLTVSSDVLLAVTKGELPVSHAWAEGKLKIEASVLDMIRLRALL